MYGGEAQVSDEVFPSPKRVGVPWVVASRYELICGPQIVLCQSYTQRLQYQQAQHKTLGRLKADRWKIDYETKEGKSARLSFICLLSNLLIIIGS